MWYFCGFNGFGQFGKAHASRVLRVTNFTLDYPKDDFLICPAWSCNIIAIGNKILLSGFVHNHDREIEKLSFPGRIVEICASDKNVLILLECGKLFKLKRDDLNIQEIVFADLEVVPCRKRKIFDSGPTVVAEVPKDPGIVHVACGNNLAVAISSNNSVYNIPTKIHQFAAHERIVSLRCGFEHAIALTSNGDVYTWGNGLRGQLGIDDLRIQESPILLEALAGIKIVSVGAGGWHSAAVSSFGDIYAWGFNCNGQLGIRVFKPSGCKNPSVYPLPQLVDLPECPNCTNSEKECSAVCVSCGARHTVIKTSCGSILAAGWNCYGQLALPQAEKIVDEFQRIAEVPKGTRTDVRCGPWSTLFKVH